jgi:hypothetical protein
MPEPFCQRFFTEPTQTLHRRYELLRAYFVEHCSLRTLAERFGLNYYTIRSLVRTFRAQCQANHVAPFLSNRALDGPDSSRFLTHRGSQNRLRSPTGGS